MKGFTSILLVFISIISAAQTLHIDDNNVRVFCEIQQTNKTILCENDAKTNIKINIWKVRLGIENGHTESIVPRGIGIADISIYPDPIKPYSHEYCTYEYVKNYEPNSFQRHLDQSLYVWPIRGYRVLEIKAGKTLINTTYLYLYEGQKPKLTNWEFLGYRLKKDFELKELTSKLKTIVISEDKVASLSKPDNTLAVITGSMDAKESTSNTLASEFKDKVVNESKAKQQVIDVAQKTTLIEKSDTHDFAKINKSDNPLTISNQINSVVVKEPELKSTMNKELIKVIDNCPGDKSLEYRKKSDTSSNSKEQKAYSWLALYYSYVCECESGSPGTDQLVVVINNVVDSYMANTKGIYGEIPKVKKCKAPVEK